MIREVSHVLITSTPGSLKFVAQGHYKAEVGVEHETSTSRMTCTLFHKATKNASWVLTSLHAADFNFATLKCVAKFKAQYHTHSACTLMQGQNMRLV